ncbi:MAG: NlpC/P60 family protein [Armatimonadetes bacterium]|nr:NlpC/P60 family protein [Armatimonadota bacterium]
MFPINPYSMSFGMQPAWGGMPGCGMPSMGMDPMVGSQWLGEMYISQCMSMMMQIMQLMASSDRFGAAGPGPALGALQGYLYPSGTADALPWGGGVPSANGAPLTFPGWDASPSGGDVSPRTRQFIGHALDKQGTPYEFGATGPTAYDCSGLVYRCLKQAGVATPRMAARYLQSDYRNSAVSRENLKPGDLLFFWYPNNRGINPPQASHVEIYLGDGKAMGTDSPKEGARVEPVDWKAFVGGARVPELQA